MLFQGQWEENRLADINFRSDMGVEYIDSMGDDRRIAEAAWASTRGDHPGKPYAGLIRSLHADNHTGTFEHNILAVRVNVPIFVAREWMRHRSQSFNEVSGRYVEMEPVFYVPGEDRPLVQVGKAMDYRREAGDRHQRARTSAAHRMQVEAAWDGYQSMLEFGVAKEVARNVLPLSLYTTYYATANLRNWFGFLSLRTDETALYEIRDAASQVEGIIAGLWPVAHEAFRSEK